MDSPGDQESVDSVVLTLNLGVNGPGSWLIKDTETRYLPFTLGFVDGVNYARRHVELKR